MGYRKKIPEFIYFAREGDDELKGPYSRKPNWTRDFRTFTLKEVMPTKPKSKRKPKKAEPDKPLPEYVWMIHKDDNHRRALVRTSGNRYYRYGGDWEVGCKWKDGKLITASTWAKGHELIPATKKEHD